MYIQSAHAMETDDKITTENNPLSLANDSFPIIIVRHDIRKRWYNENWVLRTNIIDYPLSDRTA